MPLSAAFALRVTYEQHFSNCRRVRLNYRTLSARAARTNEYDAQTMPKDWDERGKTAGKKQLYDELPNDFTIRPLPNNGTILDLSWKNAHINRIIFISPHIIDSYLQKESSKIVLWVFLLKYLQRYFNKKTQ